MAKSCVFMQTRLLCFCASVFSICLFFFFSLSFPHFLSKPKVNCVSLSQWTCHQCGCQSTILKLAWNENCCRIFFPILMYFWVKQLPKRGRDLICLLGIDWLDYCHLLIAAISFEWQVAGGEFIALTSCQKTPSYQRRNEMSLQVGGKVFLIKDYEAHEFWGNK